MTGAERHATRPAPQADGRLMFVLRRASRTPALRREVAVTVMAIGAAGCAGALGGL